MMKLIQIGALCVGLLICLPQCVSGDDVVYDVAADFSASANPTGVWSYGYSDSLGAAFQLFTQQSNSFFNPNFDAWFVAPVQHPFIAYNRTNSNQQGSGLNLDGGTIGLHPGPNSAGSQMAVVRWTAPTSRMLTLDAAFSGRDPIGAGATTDVHILHNGVSLLAGTTNGGFGAGSGPSFSSTLLFNAGDTIDFVVGNGGNDFFSDSTGLNATFSTVPEPGMSILFMVMTCSTVLVRRRTS